MTLLRLEQVRLVHGEGKSVAGVPAPWLMFCTIMSTLIVRVGDAL